jgi:putative phosphonate metabolism protein
MAPFPRYAIYYAAQQGSDLDRFGAAHLGYDAWSGEELPFPQAVLEAVPDWRALTQDPRKYGFHATLKAPMTLADGASETELVTACESFAKAPRPTPVIEPIVNALGDFIAIVPSLPSAELQALAADVVEHFDHFRAPLTAQDRVRRNPDQLPPRQRDYLDRWGYPYVMEEFRFHMTLTGRLPAARREAVLNILRQRFATLEMTSLAVDRLALFRQDNSAARFRIVGGWKLTAASG